MQNNKSGIVNKESIRYSAIDELKGVSILMVILVHTSQMFELGGIGKMICEFGQMGCQLFFVVSGFTLYNSLERKKLTVSRFYFNRWLSIAPGYWCAIILFFILNCVKAIMGKGVSLSSFSVGAVINGLLLHGFCPEYNNSIVPGGWYVGTSCIIYLLFPFLVSICKRLSKWLLMCLPVMWVVLLTCSVHLSGENCILNQLKINNSFLYFSVLNQMPCVII